MKKINRKLLLIVHRYENAFSQTHHVLFYFYLDIIVSLLSHYNCRYKV